MMFIVVRCYVSIILYLAVVKVYFEKSTYNGDERNNKKVEVTVRLVLSNPSSTDIAVKVEDSGGTATGM